MEIALHYSFKKSPNIMFKISRFFLMIISLSLIFIGSVHAQSENYQNCPAAVIGHNFGGGNLVARPDPAGPYDTREELEDAVVAASERTLGGTYVRTGPLRWSVYLTSNGQNYISPATLDDYTMYRCAEGFYLLAQLPRCVNIATKKCACPAGEKLKKSSNKCVPVIGAPPESDPEKDKGPDCPNGAGEPSQPECGNPINPNSGNKIQIERDIELSGSAAPLSLTRTYNASPNTQNNYVSSFMFGKNWSSNFEGKILWVSKPAKVSCFIWQDDLKKFCEYVLDEEYVGMSKALILKPGGVASSFSYDSIGSKYSADDKSGDQLLIVNTPDRHHVLVQGSDGKTYEYEGRFNLLKSMKKVDGTSLRFTHLSAGENDSSRTRIPLDSPICNHIQKNAYVYPLRIGCITDNWGRQLNFEYEMLPNSRLEARVSKIIDPKGNEYLYKYDGVTGGCNGESFNLSCNLNNLTSITYPDGTARLYHYNERSQINSGDVCPGERALGYSSGNLPYALTGITDENGIRFANWTYDCEGRATSSEHAGGAERVEITYEDADLNGQKRSVVKTYSGSFDSPVVTKSELVAEIINGRSKNKSISAACPGCGEALQRSYDSNGNISSYVGLNGNIVKFEYNLSRNLQISRIEAFGTKNERRISTVWHDKYNKPVKLYQSLQVSSFTYDELGNILTRSLQSTSDANGMLGANAIAVGEKITWTYTYNNYGQLTSVTSPRKDVADRTTFIYDDGGNMRSVTNSLGHTTTYGNYDLNGQFGTLNMPNGLAVFIYYTVRGKISRTESVYAGVSEIVSYEYDGVGQLVKKISPDGAFIEFQYDDAHRLVRITSSSGDSIDYELDIQGNRLGEKLKDQSGNLVKNLHRIFNSLNQLQQIIGAPN